MTRISLLPLLLTLLASSAAGAADVELLSVSRQWHTQVGGYCGDGSYDSQVVQDDSQSVGAFAIDEQLDATCGEAAAHIQFDSMLTPAAFTVSSTTSATGARGESASAGLHFEIEFRILASTEFRYECQYGPATATGNWWARLIPVPDASTAATQPDVLTWGGIGGAGTGTLSPGAYRFIVDSCSWWACSTVDGEPCEGDGNTFNTMSGELEFGTGVATNAISLGAVKSAFAPR